MPLRVPLNPQVQEQIHPGARLDATVPEGAFGGGRSLAHNVAQANQNIDIVKDEQQKIDFYDAMNGLTELKRWENESGYESVLGENARELPKRMQEEYSKRAADIAGTLKNDRQRAMFQQKADQNGVGFMGGVINHTRRQKSISEAQKTDAFVSTFQDAGIKAGAAGNFEEMDRQVVEMDGVRRISGSQLGIPGVATDRMVREESSKVYSSVIGSMLDAKNDRGAKEMFAKYRDRMTENDVKRLGPMIERESNLGEAFRLTDVVMSYEPGTLKAGLDHLDKIVEGDKLSPEVREKASQLISQKYAIQQDALEQAHKKNMGEAKNFIDGGKTFDDLPATLRSTFSASDEKDIRAYATKDTPTDDATWYTLMQMSYREPDKFANLNILSYARKLSIPDLQEMAKLQAKVAGGDTKETEGFRSIDSTITGTIKDVVKDEKDRERFMRLMNREVKAWKSNPKNKDADPIPFVEQMTDTMIKKVITDPGWLWDTRDPLYKAETQAQADASEKMGDYLRKMPMEDRQRITNDLKARGIALTESNILRFHEAMVADRRKNAGK